MGLIYLIRHAESIVNVTREFSYKLVDKSLTKKGKKQASQLADYLKEIEFSNLFSSPMKRAYETSEYISKKKNLSIRVIEELREVDVGDLEKYPPTDESWNLYYEIAKSWYSGTPERRFPNGENMHELVERFNMAINHVIKLSSGEPAVVIGHGGIFITGLAEILTNVNRKFFYENKWLNCGICIVEVAQKEGNLIGELKQFGDVSFLSGTTSI